MLSPLHWESERLIERQHNTPRCKQSGIASSKENGTMLQSSICQCAMSWGLSVMWLYGEQELLYPKHFARELSIWHTRDTREWSRQRSGGPLWIVMLSRKMSVQSVAGVRWVSRMFHPHEVDTITQPAMGRSACGSNGSVTFWRILISSRWLLQSVDGNWCFPNNLQQNHHSLLGFPICKTWPT